MGDRTVYLTKVNTAKNMTGSSMALVLLTFVLSVKAAGSKAVFVRVWSVDLNRQV